MQKKIIILAAVVLSLGCIGTLQAFTHTGEQEPQEIRGVVVDEYDAAWYEHQQNLWQKKAQADPSDEHAWEQYFSAARYADMLNDQYGMTDRKKAVLDEMAKHIPNSFTYNLAMYQTERDMQGADASLWAEKALQQIPADIGRQNTTMLIAYLVLKGELSDADRTTLHMLALSLYKNNAYPSYLLRYADNCLRGMETDALYFENGDVSFYAPLILQEALDLHTDKIIIPISFLWLDTYRDALCRKLGIKPFEVNKDYAAMENGNEVYLQDIVEHIIKESRRPAYFSPRESLAKENGLSRKLYNEGLVFRYSTHSYDNMAVAMRNVEGKYRMDYLTEPLYVNEEQWKGSERIQLNYMVMLAPVVKSYRQAGDTLHANRLTRYLSAAVARTSLSNEEKQKYFNLLGDKQ